MFLMKLISGLGQENGAGAAHGWHNLCPPRQMRGFLERERSRADRSGGRFSVIIFSASDQGPQPDSLIHPREILMRRVRCTDVLGWFDARTLVAVLVDCPEWAAQRIAADLGDSLNPDSLRPSFRVYRYPSDYPPDEIEQDGRGERRREGETPVHLAETLFTKGMPRWKRWLDVVGALIGIFLLTPLFLIVAASIKLFAPGPVLFTQQRSGWRGRPFRMYKFRSMVVGAEAKKQKLLAVNEQDGPAFKIADDPRTTPLGRFLRRSSIDELPQLWNVLKGEMTLVGPRPLLCDEQSAAARWQQRRLDVLPGLTCIWQIRGRSKVSFAQWVRMDIEYIRTFSFWNDLKILGATIPAVLLRRGAK